MSMQSMHLCKYPRGRGEESKLDTNVDNSGNSVGRYFAGGVKYVYGCHF